MDMILDTETMPKYYKFTTIVLSRILDICYYQRIILGLMSSDFIYVTIFSLKAPWFRICFIRFF